MRLSTLFTLALLALPLLHACGTQNGLVGGECRESSCGPATDASFDAASEDGSFDASSDAASDDAARDADDATDGDVRDADGADGADAGADADASNTDSDAGDADASGPVCEPPLTHCGGTCVDVNGDDPYHCGACDRFCPSFLCVAGECQGTTPGEVVIIGHDYSGAVAGTSQARLLQNAVGIAARNPIRVLSYEEHATATTVVRVKSLLGAMPRTLVFTASNTPLDLQSATLATRYDVVLIHDQASADTATATALGTGARSALHDFAAVGGVVVALDGAAGTGQMPALLTAADLLAVSAHTSVTAGTALYVTRPGDLITNQVTSTYGAAERTVSFTTSELDLDPVRWVVRLGPAGNPGEPVVVRKTITLP